jgi:hypothetical protein
VDHATKFYKELFGPSTPSGVQMEPRCWGTDELVTSQENEELEKSFSESEMKEAIFSMEKIQPLALTISQWNFINIAGIL